MAAPTRFGRDPAASRDVGTMFDDIAGRYDLLNTVLSFGLDRLWRREACRLALAVAPRQALDVATGTGDLALALAARPPHPEVLGVDLSTAMLGHARDKAERRGAPVRFARGDGQALPVPDASVDVVTIAYGLRNFEDIDTGLREFRRVLRPGGRLVVLEFPPPPRGPFGRLFRLYFRHVLPRIGAWLSGDAAAYRYLPDSVLAFPDPGALAARLRAAGFIDVSYRLQTLGVSALHVGRAGNEEEPT